jgi:hypothetical protein
MGSVVLGATAPADFGFWLLNGGARACAPNGGVGALDALVSAALEAPDVLGAAGAG